MNLWRKLGFGAAIAATAGMLGAGAMYTYDNISSVSTATEASATTNTSATKTSTEKADDTESSTSSDSSSTSSSSSSSDLQSTDTDSDLTVQEVAANTMPAMVAITNTSVQEVQNYFGGYGFSGGNGQTQSAESVSMGTGVIIGETDDSILVATNAHVISDATELSVAFVDNSAASATVVGSDTTNDLAVIKVAKSDLSSDTLSQIKVITIGSSDDLEVGEQVVAIGNALGYGQSVSTGIVSALDRSISTSDETTGQTTETQGLIQTDAAINPGNSGGALLNMKGELIGINSAKYADTSVEGMGYAIPIDTAEPILTDLANGKSTGTITTSELSGDAYLGISGKSVTSDYASYYGIPEGVYVSGVESGSAAESAGISQGDIITAIDGTAVTSTSELQNALTHYSSGDTAKLTVASSNGSKYTESTVSVTFGSKSSDSTSDSSSVYGSDQYGAQQYGSNGSLGGAGVSEADYNA
jgi:serine protease Do